MRDGTVPEAESTSPAFHLDLFPRDIFSQFRGRAAPHSTQDVIGVFGVRGIFFTHCRTENERFDWTFDQEQVLWTSDVNLACKLVRGIGGQYFHAIKVGSQMESKELVDVVRENCANLKSLSFVDSLSRWITTFGEQFEKLGCWNYSPREVSTHCSKL